MSDFREAVNWYHQKEEETEQEEVLVRREKVPQETYRVRLDDILHKHANDKSDVVGRVASWVYVSTSNLH